MKSFFMYSQAIITIKRYKWWPIIGSALLIPPSIYYIFRAPQSNDLSLFERTSTIANSSSYFGPAVLNPVNIRFPLQNYADYLIVGGGASAASAVKVIKAHHPKSKVVLVTEEDEMPYNRSAVRRELWTCSEEQRQKMSITRWDGKDSSLYLLDEDAFTTDSPSDQAITILKGRKVIKFDLKHNYAMLDNQWKIHYDKALISTGTGISSPEWLRQSVSIDAKNKVFKLQSVDDVNKAIEAVKSVKSVAVIGCGPESVELAYTISSSFNVKVTLVCTSEKGILGNMLPKWFSEKCKNSLRSSKIKVYDRVRIDKITSKDDTILIKMFKGLFRYQSEADIILLCDRDKVNDSIDFDGNLEKDENNAFISSSDMRVFHNVWCAGSACSFYDVATKCRTRLTHHDGSVATGRIAGHNMSSKFSGECSRPFYRQPIHWIDIGNDIGIENVGRIDSNLSIETILLYGNESQSVNNAEQAILFYKKDGYVVGILLWNIMGRLRVARQILYERHLNPNLKELTRRIMNHDESDFINSKNDDTEESDEANAASVFK